MSSPDPRFGSLGGLAAMATKYADLGPVEWVTDGSLSVATFMIVRKLSDRVYHPFVQRLICSQGFAFKFWGHAPKGPGYNGH